MSNLTATKARRSLGLGYALPIIGGAVSIVFGLIVYDVTRTTFDAWIWTIIQLILGGSLVAGTRLSTAAHNYSLTKKKVGATVGARNLNFILGIIWSVVVGIMSFAYAATAVSNLKYYPPVPVSNGTMMPNPSPVLHSVTVQSFLGDFLPAFVLLAIMVCGVYLLLIERTRQIKSTD
jgi:type IV secretory pathway VirB6-like protein